MRALAPEGRLSGILKALSSYFRSLFMTYIHFKPSMRKRSTSLRTRHTITMPKW